MLILIVMSTISLNAQSLFQSKLKAEIGFNRSNLLPIMLETEKINGGIGWNGGISYSLEAERFFLETGLGYRSLNFLISENLSETQKFTAKANSISIPFLVGTNFIKNDRNIAPILKTGVRLDFTTGLNGERTDILDVEDIEGFNATYELNVGAKFNRFELMFTYNTDLNKYIKTISEKNKYVGLKLAYRILN